MNQDDIFIMPKPEDIMIFHEDGRVEQNGRFLSKEEIQEMIKKEKERREKR